MVLKYFPDLGFCNLPLMKSSYCLSMRTWSEDSGAGTSFQSRGFFVVAIVSEGKQCIRYLRKDMARLIIDIHDPKKEKEVAELLLKIGGVEIERAEASPNKSTKRKAGIKRTLTAKEKKFVSELRQALKEVNDHVTGRKKFQPAREFLHGL